jgi:ankyrin repeat protein
MTALSCAASLGYAHVANVLIKNGADVNAREDGGTALYSDVGGGTALHSAVGYLDGNIDVLRVLVQNGADVNLKNQDNYTAFMVAISEILGKSRCSAKFLIKSGAEVHHVDKYGMTALHEAGRLGRSEIIRILIQSGVDVNAADKDKKTALWYVVNSSHGSAACLLHLVCGGANIDEETIKKDETGVLGLIEERLKLLRAGKRIGTSLMSEEERRFMWNLAFLFTVKHRVAAFKAYYSIRSFITYNGIFMAHGYHLGVESAWRKRKREDNFRYDVYEEEDLTLKELHYLW